ncbi:SDR family oxidoreductase [Actinomadura rupiterrae]|uniref:SDR family oxidoreductase n=1 Tax=Actinomadura rupiterrae TaxID=559627 RepID=UPI0020A2F9D7|nr:SDR family oxidoreductase [Actinomadura rupiterrae]MCP2339418.1 nucleoside-diphosphate-sugar epimerase [Actinomadura rupiterrae]
MRVFVTGASGWIGSALVPELLGAGHKVMGLARSDATAAAVAGAGAEPVRGDLSHPDTLRAAATEADGVIHLAFDHDFSRFGEAVRTDAHVIETLCGALAYTGKALVVTSGTPAVPGHVATERYESLPDSPGGARDANARIALAASDRGVRSSVVRLPRSVHGPGDRHGFVARMIDLARQKRVSGQVRDGSARWPAVHVMDAARLYRLALEGALAGSVLHAVGDEGVPTHDIAEVIGRHLNVPVESLPVEDFGFLGQLLATDQPASATVTRDLLDWRPTHPGLIDDMEKGHYFDA